MLIKPTNMRLVHPVHMSFCLGAAMMRTKFEVEVCRACGAHKGNSHFSACSANTQRGTRRLSSTWTETTRSIWGLPKAHLGNLTACDWAKTDANLLVTLGSMNEPHPARVHRIHTAVTCPECLVLFDELLSLVHS